VWFSPEVPIKLRALHKEGYKVVIFTNQAGIGTGTTSAATIKGKIMDLIKEVGVPMQAFIATKDDLFRKPSPAMWNEGLLKWNNGIKPDLKKSLFCGDAAGRAKAWNGNAKTKKDFSCGDRKFAKNVGIAFYTPEEYFLGEKPAPFDWGGFDADDFLADQETKDDMKDDNDEDGKSNSNNSSSSSSSKAAAKKPAAGGENKDSGKSPVDGDIIPAGTAQEVVVFVGFPASGKSTFARKYFVPKGYVHVNQDTMKTKEKCIKAAKEAVASGKCVVIDNTNPGADIRATYIGMAKSKGIKARCFQFETNEDMSKHLNMMREKLTGGAHKHVPRIAYAMYKKNLVAPTASEGFSDVKTVKFIASFENDEHRKLFLESA